MCRFVCYGGPPITLGSLVTEPQHSLVRQSYRASERVEPLNGDGFGVAWYAPTISDEPGVYRSISPAWSDRNLNAISRVTQSGCIFAHVRAATPGLPVVITNCHPFLRGRYAFMHNGSLPDFLKLRRKWLTALSDESFLGIEGTTDSEHIFALFMDKLAARTETEPLDAMIKATHAVQIGAGRNGAPAQLNLAVTDGLRTVVTRCTTDPQGRAESLHWHWGREYVCENGACRMVEPDRGKGAVIVSSEPLSNDFQWEPVPVNHLVAVDEAHNARLEPCPTTD